MSALSQRRAPAEEAPRAPAATRPRLQVVTAPARLTNSHRPRLPFVLLLVALLAAGLVGLLLLNTVVAQDAFALHRLETDQALLDDDEATVQARTEQLDDPSALAATARALGMVPAGDPAFVLSGRPAGAIPPGVRSVAGGTRVGRLLVIGPTPGAPRPSPAVNVAAAPPAPATAPAVAPTPAPGIRTTSPAATSRATSHPTPAATARPATANGARPTATAAAAAPAAAAAHAPTARPTQVSRTAAPAGPPRAATTRPPSAPTRRRSP